MALRFVDSFDHYVTADFTKKYDSSSNTPVISTSIVRNGTGSFQANDTDRVLRTLDAQATWIVGFAFQTSTFPGSNATIFSLLDSSSYQIRLALKSDGKLELRRGGTATSIGTAVTGGESTLVLSANTWYYLEFKVTIANSISANTCQVNVNGSQWINVTTGQDMQETGNATADVFQLGIAGGFSYPPTSYYDDLYICDGTGSKNNDFLGDVVVEAIFPDGNGTTSDFLGSDANSTDNYLHVDEVAPDGDSTYVGSSGVADRDLYTFGNLSNIPATDGIHGIVAHTASTKTEAGARVGKVTIRTGATNYDGASFNPSNGSYAYFSEVWEQNPNTVANWTETDVNGLESGIKVES